MATYDPVSTATALAENYVYARQLRLDSDSAATQNKLTATNSLKSALTSFTSALSSLSGKGGVVQQTASVSGTAATASATSAVSAGTYTFEVQTLATKQQSLYTGAALDLPQAQAPSVELPEQPRFVVSMGDGGFIAVDLQGADADGDGKLSVTEVARAINAASEGKISASVMTLKNETTQEPEQQLMLTAGQTGLDGKFTLHRLEAGEDVTAFVEALAQTPNADAFVGVAARELVTASNAHFKLGSLDIQQSSNTYTDIQGLSIEFKEAGATPVTVTVAKDEATTKSNMQSFVTAFNTLTKAIDKLTAAGNAESGVAAGALAGDSGVRSLRNQLNTLLRTSIDGQSLTSYGISAQRDGTIALDEARFAKKVAENPEAIDQLLGKTSSLEHQRTGLFGKLQTYVNTWSSSSGGLLQTRQDNLQKLQTQYTREQSNIDRMYEQAYQRYLVQFSALASLESQMSSTSSMLSAMFASSDKK